MSELGMLQWPQEVAELAALIKQRGMKSILEIGTGPGGLTSTFCNLVSGKVVSVDLPFGASSGLSYSACLERNAQLSQQHPNFVGILGDSHTVEIVHQVADALEGAPVDLLFIDGDHSYNGIVQDLSLYSVFVRPGGMIAFHDINAHEFVSHGVDVPRFWANLTGEKSEISVGGDWGGIGLLELPS